MNSIRIRLLWGVGVCLLFVFAVSGLFLYVYLHRELEASFDSALLERADIFAKTTEQHEDGSLEFEFLEADLFEYWPQVGTDYYQVWRSDGETVGRSPSLRGGDLPVALPLRVSPTFKDIDLPDGRKGKLVFLNFYPHTPRGRAMNQYTMAIGTSRTELDKAQSRVLKGLFLTGLALVLGAFPAVWWSVKRALLSLDELGEMTNTVKADNLSFRFPVDESPHELLSISNRLNDLLERLEAAFNRERRFTADAAHELRTPIAELRTLAEVGLEEAGATAPNMKEYFEDAIDIARHLEFLVSTLLTLTRCEAGIQKTDFAETNLADVTRDVWTDYQSSAEAKNIAVKCDYDPESLFMTDEGLFRAMLANIFSNAVSYTSIGGEIRISIKRDHCDVILSVINSCFELSQEDIPHIFEPFWRKEQERSNTQHCGVGLSMVAAYARLLGVTINACILSKGLFQIALHCAASGQSACNVKN
jgi:two-component system sensor histidine kinase QseC